MRGCIDGMLQCHGMLEDRSGYSCVPFRGVIITFRCRYEALQLRIMGISARILICGGLTRGCRVLGSMQVGLPFPKVLARIEETLTVVTSPPPIVTLSASSSTVGVPSASSSSTTLASIVFLPFKLLFSFSIFSQNPLLFGNLLRVTLHPHGRLGQIGWPTGVRFLAVLTVGTETGKIEFAQSLPNMFL